MLRLALGSKARAWESRPDRCFQHVRWPTITCGKPKRITTGTRQSNTCECYGPPREPGQPSSPRGSSLIAAQGQYRLEQALLRCTSTTHLEPACHGPDGGLEATAACVRVLTDYSASSGVPMLLLLLPTMNGLLIQHVISFPAGDSMYRKPSISLLRYSRCWRLCGRRLLRLRVSLCCCQLAPSCSSTGGVAH